MSKTSLTAEEVFDSLTGFDEIAVAHHFGNTVAHLAEHDTSMFGRALVFVVKKREGASDDDARNGALEMTLKELNAEFFADPSKAEAGKGESPVSLPGLSPTSVS